MTTSADLQEYEFLISQLACTGAAWDDRGYVYMNLPATDAAVWLRTVDPLDFSDTVGLSDDALQAHLIKILAATGEARTEAETEFLTWLRHRAIVSASHAIARDVYDFVPEDEAADCIFFKRQAG